MIEMHSFASVVFRGVAVVTIGVLVACQTTAPVRQPSATPTAKSEPTVSAPMPNLGQARPEGRTSSAAAPALKTAPVRAFQNYCETEIDIDTYLGSCKDGKPHGRGVLVTLGKERFFFRAYKFEEGKGYASLLLTLGRPRVLDLPPVATREGVSKLRAELKPHGLANLADRAYYIAVRKALGPGGFSDGLDPRQWSDLDAITAVQLARQVPQVYSDDDHDGLVAQAQERLNAIRLNAYRNDWALATNSGQVNALRQFGKVYEHFDPENHVAEIAGHINDIEYKTYRSLFDTARSTGDLKFFIGKYESNDPDKLVPLARTRLAQREQELEKERQAKALAVAERIKRLCASLYVGKSVNFVGDVFGVSIVPYTGLVTGFNVKQNSVSVRVTSDGDLYGNSLQIGCERLRD